MPTPSPSPGPSPTPSSRPKVQLNPDGTPDLGSAAPVSGQTTIWNMPTGLDSAKPIWFDVGHRESTPAPRVGITNEAAQAQKGGAAGKPTSYEIMSSPETIMKQFAAMSYNDPAQFLQLQLALASGPFGKVAVNGVFDPATEGALGKAMFQYVKLSHGAGVSISFSDYLLQTASTAEQLAQQQDTTTPQQVVTSDPASIREAAQAAAMDALGQGLSDDQLNAFVAKFQSAQTSAQTSTAGTVSNPDLSADAMAYAQQSDPDQYKQNQRQAYLSSLVNLLGGNLTSRPNQTPVPSVGG